MSPELEAAAAEATAEKAEAWEKFTAACAAWCRDVLHSPEDHRTLADAACEYAGKRVQRHVDAAVREEREAILALVAAMLGDINSAHYLPGMRAEMILDAIRARGQASEAKVHDAADEAAITTGRLMKAAMQMPGPKESEAPRRRVDAYTMGDELGLKRREDMETTAARPSTAPTATATPETASPLPAVDRLHWLAQCVVLEGQRDALLAERDALQARYNSLVADCRASDERLIRERDRLQEKLDQFESYGITVANALKDREERDGIQGRIAALLDEGKRGWAAAERWRVEHDALKADFKNGMRVAWALTQETQTVEDATTDLVRQVREARAQRDALKAELASMRPQLTGALTGEKFALAEVERLKELHGALLEQATRLMDSGDKAKAARDLLLRQLEFKGGAVEEVLAARAEVTRLTAARDDHDAEMEYHANTITAQRDAALKQVEELKTERDALRKTIDWEPSGYRGQTIRATYGQLQEECRKLEAQVAEAGARHMSITAMNDELRERNVGLEAALREAKTYLHLRCPKDEDWHVEGCAKVTAALEKWGKK